VELRTLAKKLSLSEFRWAKSLSSEWDFRVDARDSITRCGSRIRELGSRCEAGAAPATVTERRTRPNATGKFREGAASGKAATPEPGNQPCGTVNRGRRIRLTFGANA